MGKASLLQHFDTKKKKKNLLQNFLKPFFANNAWNLHVIKECQFWLSTYVMMMMLFINLPLGSCDDDDGLHQPSIRIM
jgi:hypothetical protein